MAKRKIQTFANNSKVANVYRNVEFDEYEVRFSVNGEDLDSDADYFTNDKQDAIDTAVNWVNEE
jgi:hypothetical protein